MGFLIFFLLYYLDAAEYLKCALEKGLFKWCSGEVREKAEINGRYSSSFFNTTFKYNVLPLLIVPFPLGIAHPLGNLSEATFATPNVL